MFLESEPSKVKFVVFLSRSSAPQPLLRRAATEYEREVAFAVVHHKRVDASHWLNKFGVRAHSAVMVIKEDGKKIVEHDITGKEKLREVLVENKLPILPQLHAESLKSTGCQPVDWCRSVWWYLGSKGGHLKMRRDASRREALFDSATASPSDPLSRRSVRTRARVRVDRRCESRSVLSGTFVR